MSVGLLAFLCAPPASAQPKRTGPVLVLEARDEPGWKEGGQALVAELLMAGYELSVRAAGSRSLEELERELQLRVADSGSSAGVSVTREGTSATTLLCRHDATSCERFDMDVSDGELSRSRLALAVVERLRPLDLPDMPEPPLPPPPPRVAPRAEQAVPTQPAAKRARPRRAWLGGGAVLSSGTSAPLSWLSASFSATVAESWGIELELGGSPLRGSAESRAGSLSLSCLQATALGSFEPWSGPGFGLSLGLGGGALRLQENATPAPGFDGFSREVTVGLISARARVFHDFGGLSWGFSIDPGMLVPAVKVTAGTQTVLEIGRPWVSLQTTVGFSL